MSISRLASGTWRPCKTVIQISDHWSSSTRSFGLGFQVEAFSLDQGISGWPLTTWAFVVASSGQYLYIGSFLLVNGAAWCLWEYPCSFLHWWDSRMVWRFPLYFPSCLGFQLYWQIQGRWGLHLCERNRGFCQLCGLDLRQSSTFHRAVCIGPGFATVRKALFYISERIRCVSTTARWTTVSSTEHTTWPKVVKLICLRLRVRFRMIPSGCSQADGWWQREALMRKTTHYLQEMRDLPVQEVEYENWATGLLDHCVIIFQVSFSFYFICHSVCVLTSSVPRKISMVVRLLLLSWKVTCPSPILGSSADLGHFWTMVNWSQKAPALTQLHACGTSKTTLWFDEFSSEVLPWCYPWACASHTSDHVKGAGQ